MLLTEIVTLGLWWTRCWQLDESSSFKFEDYQQLECVLKNCMLVQHSIYFNTPNWWCTRDAISIADSHFYIIPLAEVKHRQWREAPSFMPLPVVVHCAIATAMAPEQWTKQWTAARTAGLAGLIQSRERREEALITGSSTQRALEAAAIALLVSVTRAVVPLLVQRERHGRNNRNGWSNNIHEMRSVSFKFTSNGCSHEKQCSSKSNRNGASCYIGSTTDTTTGWSLSFSEFPWFFLLCSLSFSLLTLLTRRSSSRKLC